MVPNGIYIRCSLDHLVGELSGGLQGLKRDEADREKQTECSGSSRKVILILYDLGNGWCRVEMAGDREGIGIVVAFLTGHKSLEEVLVWDCSDESIAYNYSFFKKGKLLERLSVAGPALDAVSFKSELRQVRLQDLINGRDFAVNALEQFGLSEGIMAGDEFGRVRLDFSLPPEKSLWRNLLGVLAGDE